MKRIIICCLIFFAVFVESSNAQEIVNSAVAKPVDVDSETVEGDVICSYPDGFGLCLAEFDNNLYGVITENPSVSFEATDENDELFPLAITEGIARVKVSSVDGNINEGNKITSSQIPGVAKLATRNGYVIGTALENYESTDTENIGTILVMVNIHPATGITTIGRDLIRALREGITFTLLSPIDVLRYVLAALVVILSFVFAFVYFGRVGKKAVEAIGRNPLASRLIQSNVFMHILVTVVIIIAGLTVAYLILVL